MPRSIYPSSYDEEPPNTKTTVFKRPCSSAGTSAGHSLQLGLPSPPESDYEQSPLPEGQGTVRRKPAKEFLRHPFVWLADELSSAPGLENDGPQTPPKYTRSKTAPQPPSNPVTPESQVPSIKVIFTPPTTPGKGVAKSEDDVPFPLQPIPMIFGGAHGPDQGRGVRPAKRRCVSAGGLPLTPPATPDRFIANRSAMDDASSSFHISKPAEHLTSSERLLRKNSATSDPFRSPSIARQGRPRISSNQSGRSVSGQARLISGTNLLHPPLNRQVSTGAVWNVGGATVTAPMGPITGVPDGRGGLLGRGTNAPMYTSRFFEGNTPDQDRGRLEGRLAAALAIDQARRVVNHSQSPDRNRGTHPGGSPSKSNQSAYRTEWKDGQWVRGEALLGKFPHLECLKNQGIAQICTKRPFTHRADCP